MAAGRYKKAGPMVYTCPVIFSPLVAVYGFRAAQQCNAFALWYVCQYKIDPPDNVKVIHQ
ncbi:hypothetical protein [Desulfofundulus thermocisternus]|uniref:hypothetical protein n=1 Tax=Desulfofundulus thermocisternus TaxID=42471 RepID=UPI00217CC4B3|nr:hypothetical protein [Desulfofundulus thermocisternus]MCS5696327.1 hypothetical protein [Desulfofundulus thermocisternus]